MEFGKRARTANFDKDAKQRCLRDDIDGLAGSLSVGALAPPFASILDRARRMSPLREEITLLPVDIAHSVAKGLSSTGNGDHRLVLLAKALCPEQFTMLSQIESKVATARQLLKVLTEYSVVRSYLSDHGIDWSCLTDDLLNHLANPMRD
jgi:hypothetical protein